MPHRPQNDTRAHIGQVVTDAGRQAGGSSFTAPSAFALRLAWCRLMPEGVLCADGLTRSRRRVA
jgi:hypothetical protein